MTNDINEDVTIQVANRKHKVLNIFKPAVKFVESDLTLSLPSHTNKVLSDKLKGISLDERPSESQTKWRKVIEKSVDMVSYADGFVDSLNREGSEFEQIVEVNDTKLRPSVPAIRTTQNENLKGDRGIMRALTQLGLGTVFMVPLYSAGFWVKFKAPTEGYLLDLNRALIADKVNLGRSTYGLAFSSTSSYTHDRILDAVLDHISEATINIADINRVELLRLIPVMDLNTLIWGFACTMFPNGVQYERACVADPEKCDFVIKELLDLTFLHRVDKSQLTAKQKAFMVERRPNTKTIEQVKDYQSEFLINGNRAISINSDNDSEIIFNLKTPSIAEYIEKSNSWISEIVEVVETALTDHNQDERNNFINAKAAASVMRQFTHYVDSVELVDSNFITDPNTIQELLDVVSTDDKLRSGFIEKVVKYINETALVIIAIDSFDCPKCGEKNEIETGKDEFKELIPLDILQLFFTLLSARMRRLRSR